MFTLSTFARPAVVAPAARVAGDRMDTLYRAHGPAVYARCRRILGDSAAAEDAAQETFLRVHRHLDEVPEAGEALRWIYRVATNYCLNQIRDRKRRQELWGQAPELLARELTEALADRDLVRWLIARVPEKQRAVAWLYHVDGMEQQEVADVLGISRRTVVSRLSGFEARARRQLEELR
jgi:RNA polymerase sigma-70 factor (ECF subfamily)